MVVVVYVGWDVYGLVCVGVVVVGGYGELGVECLVVVEGDLGGLCVGVDVNDLFVVV